MISWWSVHAHKLANACQHKHIQVATCTHTNSYTHAIYIDANTKSTVGRIIFKDIKFRGFSKFCFK